MFPASSRPAAQSTDLPSFDANTSHATRLSTSGLGERWLLADPAHGALEVLKFKKTFLEAAEFEARLRRRVDELRALRHNALAVVRSVEWLDGGEGLGLISVHVPGRRLSEVLSHARGPAFAYEFIRQVTPAIAALQQVRPGMAHGALTADRVVVMRDGRLVVQDISLAAALESMRLPPHQLREDIGIAVPDAPATVPLDSRLDVVQIGFIALSLLLGRALDPSDFRSRIPALLDEMSAGKSAEGMHLRGWLEHALQLTERPFESAVDALEALPAPAAVTAPSSTVVAFRPEKPAAPAAVETPPVSPSAPTVEMAVNNGGDSDENSSAEPVTSVSREAPTHHDRTRGQAPRRDPVRPLETRRAETRRDEPSVVEPAVAAPVRTRVRLGLVHWLAILLAVAASVEAAAIAGLLTTRPGSPPVPALTIAAPTWSTAPAAPPLAPAASADAAVGLPVAAPSNSTIPPPTVPAAEPASPTPEGTARPRPAGQVGGVRVTAPFEAHVYEGGALIGSTAGPIALGVGDHDLEVVNETFGLRVRQRVTVRAGALATVPVAAPPGRVNINAAPWASAWINGTAAGDTPLANVSLPAGSHEFVFRHPQLGEQRLVAIVKADAVTRVSASFQR
jgi:hypothetical protein